MRAEGSEGVLNDSKCCPSNQACKHNELEDIPNLHVMMVLRVPCFPPLLARNLQLALALLHPDQRGHRIPP